MNSTPAKATDYFGVEIEVGDIVAYCTTASSSAQMNHGRVLAVEPYTQKYRPDQYFKIIIRKIGESGYSGGPMRHVETSRAITIHELQRCINLSKYKEQTGDIPSA